MGVQVCILDGNKYTSRCREMGEQRLDILDECEVSVALWCSSTASKDPPQLPVISAWGRAFFAHYICSFSALRPEALV